jgi:hypothetical protein
MKAPAARLAHWLTSSAGNVSATVFAQLNLPASVAQARFQEGLYPEAERMKQLVRDCDIEMTEMDLIESYQRDERREAEIQIEGQY